MQFKTFARITRIEESLYGLPNIFSAFFLSLQAHDLKWVSHSLWIIPAFLLARIAGMAFNQLIDRHIDSKNPRTMDRSLPQGAVTPLQVLFTGCTSLLLFILICAQINFYCFIFSPFVAFILVFYSYVKRFHFSSHFVLGLVHFLAPFMASIAAVGDMDLFGILVGGVAFWTVSGNDILYSLQDLLFDRKERLHSIPARFGLSLSHILARGCHSMAIVFVLAIALISHSSSLIYLTLPLMGAGFLWTNFKGPKTFIVSNAVVSFSLLIGIVVEKIWHVM